MRLEDFSVMIATHPALEKVNIELLIWVSGSVLGGVFLLIMLLKTLIVICPPNRVMVVSGRSRGKDGKKGYNVYFGGRAWRIPLLETVNELDLTTIPISIAVHNVYSKGGIALHVQAVANVKISPDPAVINSAIERFLGRDLEDVMRAAKDTLEGNLRESLATLTPEEVNEDRLAFANRVREFAEEDLRKLGLHLDILKIQHVSDDNQYLDSIGRKQIAQILRDAEIAESNAKREAENVAADAHARARVAVETTQAEVAKERNALEKLKAELEAKARTEEETTSAAAFEARAKAEQELQKIRGELEKLRLQADEVIPAEAMREAREMQAKGEAAPIAENGKALALALDEISASWRAAGENAKDIFLIQQLEKILSLVVSTVNDMEVSKVHLIDNGEGNAVPNYVSSFPATVASILKTLRESTGIDVTEILAGSSFKSSSSEQA